MEFLNYHHLFYFWVTAREGSIVKAAERLHLSQPTISAQIHMLERSMGMKLFAKSGRALQLTESGQTVLRYADEIFSLGKELQDVVRGVSTGKHLRFTVGVPDSLPKHIVFRLLQPALEGEEDIRLHCHEGTHEDLLRQLAAHELDLVLSDLPAAGNVKVKVFNHLLGKCGLSFFGTPDLAKHYRRNFPESLNDAPLLLPVTGTVGRRQLDQWFDEQNIHPLIKAEIQDGALLKVFGQGGLGLFTAPAALCEEIEFQYHVKHIGTIEDLQQSYYAISAERRLKHTAVVRLTEAAKAELFL
jgi:LysR family transcriptional activator of nhaA